MVHSAYAYTRITNTCRNTRAQDSYNHFTRFAHVAFARKDLGCRLTHTRIPVAIDVLETLNCWGCHFLSDQTRLPLYVPSVYRPALRLKTCCNIVKTFRMANKKVPLFFKKISVPIKKNPLCIRIKINNDIPAKD